MSKYKQNLLLEGILITIGLAVFALFIRSDFPSKLMAIAGIVTTAYIIARKVLPFQQFTNRSGLVLHKNSISFLLAGMITGLAIAMIYRYSVDMPFFPSTLTWFALMSATIGLTEELVFRGYLQGSLKNRGAVFAIVFASFSHTMYKSSLFLLPVAENSVNLHFLVLWTFLGGLLFGVLRHWSKSVVPALIAHALFDILVYGDRLTAPWWVW